MKSIAKIICCGVALAWMHGATAKEDAAAPGTAGTISSAAAPADDRVVPTPPAPRIAVKPYHDKVDRAKVEKRIEDNAKLTRKRSTDSEKDAAERAKVRQRQANPARNAQ